MTTKYKFPTELPSATSVADSDLVIIQKANQPFLTAIPAVYFDIMRSLAATDGNIIVGDGTTWVAESGATARTSLGLTIGTNVQAYNAGLADIAGLAKTDGNIIVGNGTTWVAESDATARTSLGLTIGTNVQAYNAGLADIAGLAKHDGTFIVGNGTNWVAEIGSTARESLGAAPATGDLSKEWWCSDVGSSTGYFYRHVSGGSNIGNISLYDTGVSNRMVFRNNAGFQFYALTGTTLQAIYAGDIYQNGVKILEATGWNTNPVALGSVSPGVATTISRSDHVHPMPSAANVGAMSTSHAANAITALGGTSQALGSASNGSGTTVALSNHVHPMPSAANVGAAPSGGDLAVDWLCKDLRSATGYLYRMASGGSNVGNISLYDTGVSNCTVFRNGAGFRFYGLSGTTAASVHVGSLQTRTILPEADSTYTIGVTGNRFYRGWFDELYVTAGAVSGSDSRLKADIADSDLGLDFIASLRPRRYRMKARQVVTRDEAGAENSRTIPGIRPHYGFVAQEVKEAMGAADFAGYVDIDLAGDQLGLRYEEFIAPLVKAVQELHNQAKEDRQARLALAQRLAALEMALGPVGASRAKA